MPILKPGKSQSDLIERILIPDFDIREKFSRDLFYTQGKILNQLLTSCTSIQITF